MNRLRQWLEISRLTDPVERQQAHGYQWVLMIWIAFALISNIPVVINLLFPPPPPPGMDFSAIPFIFIVLGWLSIGATLMLWICPLVALLVLRSGRFKLSVGIASLGLLVIHSIGGAYNLGVANSAVSVVFQIPIALAGLLGGRRLLLTVSGLSIAVFCGVAFLQLQTPPMAGFFGVVMAPDGSFINTLTPMSLNLILEFFIGITILLTVLLDRFGGALRVALTNSLDREAELQEIRASLQNTVADRTAELRAALKDVQARAETQAKLLAEIEEQRAVIKELSVPVIPVSKSTLVMPLVGALDGPRLRQVQEQSLRALSRTSARTLVLDITGVPVVDSQVTQGFLMTMRSARMLGAQVMLVGIRPEVAQSIIGLGVELRDINAFSDLQSALAHISA